MDLIYTLVAYQRKMVASCNKKTPSFIYRLDAFYNK